MKRFAFAAFASAAALASAALSFTSIRTQISTSGLRVAFKLSGLQEPTSVAVHSSATATATWACVNKAGRPPSSEKLRRVVTEAVQGHANVRVGPTGSSASVLLGVPRAEGFTCPEGLQLRLAALKYADVRLRAPGAAASAPGTSKVFLVLR